VSCVLVNAERHFREAYCLHHQGSSKRSVNIYLTTGHNIPEHRHFIPIATEPEISPYNTGFMMKVCNDTYELVWILLKSK
jgi:hypothetical protein